jgi:hypothetical protein
MRSNLPRIALVLLLASCATTQPRVPDTDEARALGYAERADASFRAGQREQAFLLATRALVVRLAACGYDCPEVGVSFVQLGDLRLENGQAGWAAQSYRKALEVFEPHRKSHEKWIRATEARLRLAKKHDHR